MKKKATAASKSVIKATPSIVGAKTKKVKKAFIVYVYGDEPMTEKAAKMFIDNIAKTPSQECDFRAIVKRAKDLDPQK